jgi:hypothetical protein
MLRSILADAPWQWPTWNIRSAANRGETSQEHAGYWPTW